jgi:hypothetical protein
MVPRRSLIIKLIPPPSGSEEKIVEIQSTDDILMCVYNSYTDSEAYTKNYASLFAKGNINEDGSIDVDGVCHDIWDFMQDQWPYDPGMAETEHRQEGRSVRAIIYNIRPRKFDCKHYATFAFATLQALGIKCELRLTSYDDVLPMPSHIYVAAFDKEGKAYIIDGTMPEYNEESQQGVTQRYIVKIGKQ